MDDVEADPDLRKNMKLYKDSTILRQNMTKEELEEALGELDLCEMLDDLKIEEVVEKNKEQPDEENEGIDDLIAKMENVTIEKE